MAFWNYIGEFSCFAGCLAHTSATRQNAICQPGPLTLEQDIDELDSLHREIKFE